MTPGSQTFCLTRDMKRHFWHHPVGSAEASERDVSLVCNLVFLGGYNHPSRCRGSVLLWWSLSGTCHVVGEFTVHSGQMEPALFMLSLACSCASLQCHCRTVPQLLQQLNTTDWSSQSTTSFTTHTEASPHNRPLSQQGSWEILTNCVGCMCHSPCWMYWGHFPSTFSVVSSCGILDRAQRAASECKPCYKLTGAKFLSLNPLVPVK